MKILIIAEKNDSHAVAVEWALRSIGYSPVMWNWSHFPKSDLATYRIDRNGIEDFDITIDGVLHHAPFDVIWHRRPRIPMPSEHSHPDDHKVIVREASIYLKNVMHLLAHEHTRWINPVPELNRANNKLVQLKAAVKLGFNIPDTLVGNDFEAIKSFYDKHQGKMIYKAFAVGGWYQERGPMTVLRTSTVTPELMEDSTAFTQCPGIFQEQIDKAYEVRVTVMGDDLLVAKIDSQKNGDTVDWRYDLPQGKLPIQKILLPEAISAQCIAYCKYLGLVFGCIDFIVNMNGDYIFLEINEAGQFLWKEELDPSLNCLSAFCNLITATDSSRDRKSIDAITLACFDKSASFREWTRQQPNMVKDDPGFILESPA